MKLLPAAGISALLIAGLMGCAGPGAPETPSGIDDTPPGVDVAEGVEADGVVCDFLSSAAIATVVPDATTPWNETALSETACEWNNPEAGLTLTIEVLTGRDAALAAIEEPTTTAMIGPHETTVVRSGSEPGIQSAYIVAGFDYFVKTSQSPALLTDEQFSELAYPAAIEFENSPLNVG